MNVNRRLLPVLLFLLIPTVLVAQRQNNVWYFGWNAGLDFNGSRPISIGGSSMGSLEGCASVSNRRTGQLLFYTNGATVWNRLHVPMPANHKLAGDPSSTQSALIVPMPGDSLRYYIFTTDSKERGLNTGLSYSIVDMARDGGLGDVMLANARLLAPVTEKVTAIARPDGDGYWILTHGWRNNNFYAFALTEDGLGESVVSSVGMIHQPPSDDNSVGYLKASPDGRRIACAIRDMMTVEIFDFDPNTGRVSAPISIQSPINGCQSYGIAFSPDNNLLYVAEYYGGIYQYDLRSGNAGTITASRYMLWPLNGTANLGALQLAPDGRIYCSIYGQKFLSIIANPNGVRQDCGFIYEGIRLSVGSCAIGLPNNIDADHRDLSSVDGSHTTSPGSAITGNHPNPFRDATTVEFTLARPGTALVQIIDARGTVVATLSEGTLEAGTHRMRWDASGQPSGVYIARVASPAGSTTYPIVLAR